MRAQRGDGAGPDWLARVVAGGQHPQPAAHLLPRPRRPPIALGQRVGVAQHEVKKPRVARRGEAADVPAVPGRVTQQPLCPRGIWPGRADRSQRPHRRDRSRAWSRGVGELQRALHVGEEQLLASARGDREVQRGLVLRAGDEAGLFAAEPAYAFLHREIRAMAGAAAPARILRSIVLARPAEPTPQHAPGIAVLATAARSTWRVRPPPARAHTGGLARPV
jgi:hypothetical protein